MREIELVRLASRISCLSPDAGEVLPSLVAHARDALGKYGAVSSQDRAEYNIKSFDDDAIISKALEITVSRMKKKGGKFTTPQTGKDFAALKLRNLEHEVFAVIFLDNRHRLIEYTEMFRGTVDGASVHTREVVKDALKHNAAAVILAHNHPSGEVNPSRADEQITLRLKDALALVDVRVLDHMIVGETVISLAERGLI